MSNNNTTIHQQITKLLVHNMTLSEFQHWLFTEAHDAEHGIIYDIKLLFAEHDHGDWTDDEMMRHLRDALECAAIEEEPSVTLNDQCSTGGQKQA